MMTDSPGALSSGQGSTGVDTGGDRFFMVGMNRWILASRPKTLPAAVVPVVLGMALATHDGGFALLPALICLAFALLIQIGTNFANDYFDFVKGADNETRVGPTRAVASGLVAPVTMKRATHGVFALAFVIGCALIPYGGWGLALIGVLSILCGYAYTGGPYPLGYNGLGDIFVFIFFGLIATGCTYYVQAGVWTWDAALLGCIPGALSTNILVVNNLRDVETDRVAGKRTLAVRLGIFWGEVQYVALWALALVMSAVLAFRLASLWLLAPWLLTAWAVQLTIFLHRSHGRSAQRWGRLLASTAKFLLLFGILQGVGLLVAAAIN